MSPGTAPTSYPLAVLYAQAAEAFRTRSRTLSFAARFLPPDLARSAHAIYWFHDYTRSLALEAESAGHLTIGRWAGMVSAGLRGELVRHPVLEVFLDTAGRCGIPPEQPAELVEAYSTGGARCDNFSQLAAQCRRTGGAVSLMLARVIGYRDPAPDYMLDLGIAAELTAGLRDFGERLTRGYLGVPVEEMSAFGYTEADLEARTRNAAFTGLMRYQAARIHGYFDRVEPGLALLDSSGRHAARAAFDLYRRTLRRIEASGFDVFRKAAPVPALSRYWITARSMAAPVTRRLWKGRSA